DFNPMVQETINRVQSDEQNNYVLEESRRLGFNSVNLDLIYGLPHQTLESYSETMKQVIEMSPDRLAVFNYAHVPWLKKHQTILPVDKMPMPDERLKMLKMIIEKLTDADYAFIGMDHFAKPEDELTKALNAGTLHRNFQGYTTRSGTEVLAMGVSSISQLERSYTQNTKNVREYEQRLDESILPINVGICLTDDDIIRRYVIGEIMCNHRLDFRAVERRYEINFATYFPDFYQKLEPFFEDGLVEVDSQSIRVLSAGKLVVRNIAMIFDAYLGQSSSGKKSANASSKQPRYSQTV
ncbi:MAG: oxygen-independent coproporphyrinogen III oxidase, partial [Calditrichota bacterium]